MAANGLSFGTSLDQRQLRRQSAPPQIIVGIFLLVFGYWIGGDHARLVFFGQRTTGKLVGYQEEKYRTESGGVPWASGYMPVVEFTVGRDTVRFQDWMASHFSVPMGGTVPVLFDPARPANAVIDRPVWNYVPWAPMFGIALLLLVSGIRGRLSPL